MSNNNNNTDNSTSQVTHEESEPKKSFLSNPTNNPWKDNQGRWLTAPLFWEKRNPDFTPKYTLHEDDVIHDGIKYLSLKKIYLSYPHAPGFEYEFANDYLGGWNHWNRIVKSIIRDDIQEWRDELEIKQKAQGIKKIIRTAESSDAVGFNANKYLVEKGYLEKEGKGRPKKADIAREARIAAEAEKELEDDLQRLRVVK